MTSKITFYGGAGSVTGANFMLDTGSARILVDCGTVAVESSPDDVNHEPFAYDVHSVQALVVTHAHADHIGRIPKLVRDGFRGAIYSTGATHDIAEIMFEDALHIMEEESLRSGTPVLYESDDIDRTMALWKTHTYHEPFHIQDVTVEFADAGHILGSALVRFSRGGRTIIFTGDLGNTPEPLLRDTESPEGANYLVMESVYGDRLHEERGARKESLRSAIEDARVRKGTLLIPSFSVERTQVLLYEIHGMIDDGSMAPIPIFVDSPLASRVTPVFTAYGDDLNEEAKAMLAAGGDLFSFPGLSTTRNKNESMAIHKEDNPKVIIAGAGMSAGGRIRAHEAHYLGDKNATVLFVGFQAPGTLGRRLQDGQSKVNIDGEYIRVHAQIASLTGYSGHADRDQLMQFVENAGESLETVFVTMGETKASLFLAQRITDFLGIKAQVPKKGESQTIEF
ncbi:MAG: MBL fold metallo-hydrolase [Candidatus Pacebacteria bacterium]|nr:MBL fold metallo-hydrolase [Candidatus Paceibacterota bacterium]